MTNNLKWAEYNCIDGAVTFQCWDQISSDLNAQGYMPMYEDTMRLYPILLYMMTRGIKVERKAMEDMAEDAATEIEAKQADLDRLAGQPLNPLSPKQCFEYFYHTLGHTPYLSAATGRPTTDDKAMARLARKGVREAKLVQEIRALNKMKSTYYDVAIDPDGRLRSAFNPRGTKNMRLSSSQTIFGTGMNFQNIPPRFKKFMVADDNCIFIEFDKEQSEWVISAYASGDPHMINAIESGLDIHINTSHMFTGVSADLIKREAAIIGESTDQDWIFQQRHEKLPQIYEEAKFLPRSMSCRQAGKRSNHGLNYYMGHKRFALENEMPEKEAKTIVDMYRAIYSCLPVWWDQVSAQLQKDRTITNCFGFKRRFLDEYNHELVKQAISFIPQSTNVVLINRGMVANYWSDAEHMQPLEQLAQVHDSILTQYPVGRWKELAKCMITVYDNLNPTMTYNGRDFQIGTGAKVGLNWGDAVKVKIVKNATEMADRLEQAYGEIVQ